MITAGDKDATDERDALLRWYTARARPLLSRRTAPKLLQKIDEQAEELGKLAAHRPTAEVAFLGSTTAGKSTSINALLQRRLLPENRIGSTTAAKVEIRYGPRERLLVTYVPAEPLREDLGRLGAEWASIDADAAERGELPTYDSIERLRSVARNALGLPPNHQLSRDDLKRDLPAEVVALLGTKVEYDAELEQRVYDHIVGRYWSIVDNAVLELPHELLGAGLCIVDLPGTGDTDQGRLEALRRYVDRADQFVLVLGQQLVTADVQALLLETDLLLKLVARRRPLIVVGTKLDGSNPPLPEELATWNLAGGLTGLRAAEAMWCAKAEQKLHELMKQLVGKLHRPREGERPEDYDGRVRDHFGRSAFIPINPRAALELNPATSGVVTDLTVKAWREKYPQDADLGIDELRQVLREVANARRHEHEAELDGLTENFRAVAQSELAQPAQSEGGLIVSDELAACAAALTRAEQGLDGVLEEAQQVGQGLVEAMAQYLEDLARKNPALPPRLVVGHLTPKHHATVKASVRAPRNGIWNTIHVPKALFEALQLQVVEHWARLQKAMGALLDRHDAVLRAYCDVVEQEVGARDARILEVCGASLASGRRVLLTHAEIVRRDFGAEAIRLGIPLSDEIERFAREALSGPCGEAALFSGQGTKDRIVEKLAQSAGQVGNATVHAVRELVDSVKKALLTAFRDRVVGASRRTLLAVGEDVTRALEAAGRGAVPQLDRAQCLAVLREMPGIRETEVPAPESVGSPSRRAGPAPFSLMIGATAAGNDVIWDPSRSGAPLNNYGLLVTGDSGTGKTQFLRALISEAAAHEVPVCVFDFKNDYSEPEFSAASRLHVHDVSRSGLPFNPLALTPDRRGEVQPIRHVHEIADILARVFGLGDRQVGHLRKAMDLAYSGCGIQTREYVAVTPHMRVPSFSDVVDLVNEHETSATSLIARLSPLFDLGLFPSAGSEAMSFEDMLAKPLVLDFHDLPNDRIKAALAEVVILRIHGHVVRGAQHRELNKLLVFDEAWRVAKSAKLQELAREGRAFGVGIAIGTQFPGDLPDTMTGNLATQLSLQNATFDHRRSVAQQLCGSGSGPTAQQIMDEITGLKKHEGFFRNGHYVPYVRVATVPHFARRQGESTFAGASDERR
jgi:hypothetical protein